MNKLKELFKKILAYSKENWDLVATLLITVVAFFVMFGPRAFNVYDTDWVNKGGDFTVSYLGSVFYRMDEWHWPIFMHDNMGYPFGISVHGTDGSPMLSLIFKVFHKWFGLPATAQFVGPWMFICYILQAVASVYIFRHAFKNKFMIILGSLFFISSPIMLMRVFVHVNLMPHFILLFSILLWLNNRLGKKEWIYINILYTLCMLTCPYYLPMCTGFFVLLWYKQVIVQKSVSWKSFAKGILATGAVMGIWYYLLGMYQTGGELSGGGWRGLALNLTALFNPIWSKSQFFNTLTPKADFDADNYFGLGLLILLILCLREVIGLFSKEKMQGNGLLVIILTGFVVFALSPQVKLGTVMILDYKPGALVEWIGGVFRYSGRFFWPVWYLLAYFIIKTAYYKFGKMAFVVVPVLLLVQIWDLYPTYKSKASFIWEARPVPVATNTPEWDELAKRYDNVFIFAHNKNYRDVWKWAIKHNKNVNYGFLNSRATKKPEELVNKVKEEILSGYVSDPTYFYIIDEDLMARINDVAKINPDVAKLKSQIRRVSTYDILEYDAALQPVMMSFSEQKIKVNHRYWQADLIMTSKHRLYRVLEKGDKDYATITRHDDMLVLKWDRYGTEEFKKGRNGEYWQIYEGKSIEPAEGVQ